MFRSKFNDVEIENESKNNNGKVKFGKEQAKKKKKKLIPLINAVFVRRVNG